MIKSKEIIFDKIPIRCHRSNALIWTLSVLKHPNQKIDWVFKSMIHLYLFFSYNCIDKFIDGLVEGGEIALPKKTQLYRHQCCYIYPADTKTSQRRCKNILFLVSKHYVKSVRIRIFFWSVFSPNTGKYGPDKSPYLDTFYTVKIS